MVSIVEAPVYEAAAVFRRWQSRQGDVRPRREVVGGSRKSSREVREEVGKSAATEGRSGVAVCELELVCVE